MKLKLYLLTLDLFIVLILSHQVACKKKTSQSMMSAAERKKAKREKNALRRRLEAEISENEEDQMPPYLGGYNSQDSTMMTVRFSHVREGRQFREMVEDF